MASKLHQGDLYATSFHGGLSQGARKQALDEFKEKRWDVVVTTDLAARGIDISQLPVVVNYDLPRSAVDYVHRIGRTGRAGASGLAVSFVTPASEAHWHLIEKRQGLSLPLEVVPGLEPTEVAPVRRSGWRREGQAPEQERQAACRCAARRRRPAQTLTSTAWRWRVSA